MRKTKGAKERASRRGAPSELQEVLHAEERVRPVSQQNRQSNRASQRSQLSQREAMSQSQQARASIGFESWKRESLEAALANAGVTVPRGASHKQLVRLASSRFDGRQSLPVNQKGQKVRYTSRKTGVKYLESSVPQERPSSVPHDSFLYFNESPVQAEAGGRPELGSTPPPSSFRSMKSLLEGPAHMSVGLESEDDLQERRQLRLEKAMHEEFIRPSVRKAKAFANEHHPRKKDGRVYSLCSTSTGRHCCSLGPCGESMMGSKDSEFARFGPGVALYFKWLKWLTSVFLCMSVIVGPQIVFNFESYTGKLFTGIGFLEATEISSLSETGLNRSFVSSSILLGGNRVIEPFLDCDDDCLLNRERLAFLYTFTNMGAIGFFIMAVGYLALFEHKEKHRITKHAVSVDDYTVQFVRTPPGCGEGAIKRFFQELTGEPVLEVHIANNDGKLISHYMKRGRLIHKLWKAASSVYMLKEEKAKAEEAAVAAVVEERRRSLQHHAQRTSRPRSGDPRPKSGGSAEAKHASLPRRLVSIDLEEGLPATSERKAIDRRSRRYSHLFSLVHLRDAVEATAEKVGIIDSKLQRAVAHYDQLYAEFEAVNERHRHLHAGSKARSAFVTFETQIGYLRCLDLFPKNGPSKTVKFQGKAVHVRPAPPPSTIIWENFDYSWSNKFCRRMTTTFLVFLVVLVSVVLTYFGSIGRQVLKNEIATSKCFLPPNITSIEALEDQFERELNRVPQNATLVDELEAYYLECACGLVTYSQAASAAIDRSDPCYPFWVDKAPLFGYTFVLGVMISITNYIIRVVLSRFAKFEKHQSLVGMELSLSFRVFLVLLFNTGFVVFLVNYDFSVFGLDSVKLFGITGYSDFIPNWYADVGLQVLLIMLVNVFAPHGFMFAELCYVKCFLRNPRCKRPSSQRELNEWFTGPVFRLNYRIAHNLMTVFVTLAFGPGLPLLYPLAFLSFFLYYWVDKYLVIRYYQTPPRYDARLADQATGMMLYAVILNLVSAVWMYSAPGFFWFPQQNVDTDGGLLGNAFNVIFKGASAGSAFEEIRTRLSLPFILPLLLFLVVYVGVFVLVKLFRPLGTYLHKALDCVLCGLLSKYKVSTIYIHPPLYLARRRKILRGLSSYSILQNPTYSNAFGIDENFVRKHRTVGSMQNLTSDQLPTLPVV